MPASVKEMIHSYVQAWNNETLEEFKTAFAECWAPDATYLDPNFDMTGVDAISGLAVKSLELFPGRIFSVLIEPEYHHRFGRYTWKVQLPNGTNEGTDFFSFDEQFRIKSLVSFFQPA